PVFRIFCPALAIALFAGGLPVQTAGAQTPVPGLVPHVDLNASLDAGPEQATMGNIKQGLDIHMAPQHAGDNEKLFHDAAPEEGGWKGLARLLEALTPNIDTSLPLTPAQITTRISNMLDQGQNQEALAIIE